MNTTIRFHRTGAPDVLQAEDIPVGPPAAGQVRLKQDAIGVNFVDTLFRQGSFPVPLPAIAGVEGAGTVDAVGAGVTSWKVGDRAAYFLAPGSYTQSRNIAADALVRLPDDVSNAQAATILTKGLTAWAGLNGYHRLQAGQKVLVLGASSSVGILLSRWAKASGAFVIGTAGSPEKQALLTGTIDHVLPSAAPDLLQRIRHLAPDGVDVVYDFVGAATSHVAGDAVKNGGRIVNIGAASGAPTLDLAGLSSRQVTVVGGPMAQHLQGAALATAVQAVFDAWRGGLFGHIEVTRYPLASAAQAHQDIAQRHRTGAMILVP